MESIGWCEVKVYDINLQEVRTDPASKPLPLKCLFHTGSCIVSPHAPEKNPGSLGWRGGLRAIAAEQ